MREGYEFKVVPIADPKVFPHFKDKENQEKFYKWGIQETIEVAKFRFNKNFHLIGAEEYLKDLFNSRDVIGAFAPLKALAAGDCTGVKFTHMNCNVLNMSYFDIFEEIGVCGPEGHIK